MATTSKRSSLMAALLFISLGISVSADPVTIAEFRFTGNSAASSDSEPMTSTSDITQGAGISGTIIANDRMEVRGNQTTASNGHNTLEDQQPPAIAADDYVTFTVTVPDGQVVSLTSLNYGWATQNPYRQSYGIYSDKTGFSYATILDGQHVSGGTSTSNPMSAFTSRSVNLSGIESLQELTDTTVEFRFYIAHPQSATSLRAWAFDDIVLQGTVQNVVYPGTVLIVR